MKVEERRETRKVEQWSPTSILPERGKGVVVVVCGAVKMGEGEGMTIVRKKKKKYVKLEPATSSRATAARHINTENKGDQKGERDHR